MTAETSRVPVIPSDSEIRVAYEYTNLACSSFVTSNVIGLGALFGPDQNAYPSLSLWSLGKMLNKS